MNEFSLTKSVLAESKSLGASVRVLGSTDVISSEEPLAVTEFETRVGAMRVWCRSIEKTLLARRFERTRVHAGFERLSRVGPVMHRYRQLAATAEELTVYGIVDREISVTGMRVVALDREALANEWFVAVHARGFGALVVAEDLDGFGGGPRLAERRFRGLVTHHPKLIAFAMSRLDAFAEARTQSASSSECRA